MNRLILIGNGFDLAHGYKTSYTHFIIDYLRKSFLNTLETPKKKVNIDKYSYKEYPHFLEDPLLKINLKTKFKKINYVDKIIQCNDINSINEFTKLYEFGRTYKSKFLNNTINHCEKYNWVDIENEYFQLLLSHKILYTTMPSRKEEAISNLKLLNSELDYLTIKLEEYLCSLETENTSTNKELLKIFTENIQQDEIVTTSLLGNPKPSNIYFLNFNYTSTLKNYIKKITPNIPCEINHIHGELNQPKNPLIFGFGDEIDKSYKEIEELNKNIFFKHIKSFKYFKTSKYHDLIRFTESDNFQVYIIGHSCGLSDRTLLKSILEHENCKSIKIFFYDRADGTNDYTEKTFDISRHFEDKGIMRKKIIPFEKSSPIPKIII